MSADGSSPASKAAVVPDAAPAAVQKSAPGAADVIFLQNAALRRGRVERRLEALFGEEEACGADPLGAALRAACRSPGKRVRPLLALLAADHFGGRETGALEFGCALELLHTASLILDDLPCMDDALLRRGLPAFHLQFGEDGAVLAAVALISRAFGLVAVDPGLRPETRLRLQSLLSRSVGLGGLASGQFLDLRGGRDECDASDLDRLNRQKTSALFIAAVVGGALIAEADPVDLERAERFGGELGLAFQLLDDLIDADETAEAAGKDVGQDASRPRFLYAFGRERTEAAVAAAFANALDALGARDSDLTRFARSLAGKFRALGAPLREG